MANTRLFQNLVCTVQGTFAPLYLRRLVYGNNDKFVIRTVESAIIEFREGNLFLDEGRKQKKGKGLSLSFPRASLAKKATEESERREEIERRLIGMSGMERTKKRPREYRFFILYPNRGPRPD